MAWLIVVGHICCKTYLKLNSTILQLYSCIDKPRFISCERENSSLTPSLHQLLIYWSLLVMMEQIFLIYHRCGGSLSINFRNRKLKDRRKAPTCGHCAEVGRKRPFHHRGMYFNRHQASCRHLWYIELFPHSRHLPWGSYGSAHSTKGALLHPQWKSCVLSSMDS